MSDMSVANTILSQLGGNKFVVMTGAKNLMGSADTLMFRLPGGALKRINAVKIKLDASDTYTMTFSKVGTAKTGWKIDEVASFSDVYADQLQTIFTKTTGLHTRLF